MSDTTSDTTPDTTTDPAPYSLTSRLVAELFGTFVLVFAVIGAAFYFVPVGQSGALPVALSVGLGVLAAAYAVGH
ncbi:MAG TPA: MIP family channel protein, partial [Pseudolysinimonas sp.]|nr:MIP family channel protein [Pseudolysinimonas sp.]